MHINFPQNIFLEDEVVKLRLLERSDFDYLVEYAINEPDTWYYSLVRANGTSNLAKYIDLAVQAKENQSQLPFIVFDKRTNKYVGSTRFYDINFDYQTLQLGYTWYSEIARGSGLNKHCKFLLLQYAFEALHLERVEFRADNANIRSIAAMKSIGCVVEGVLRNHMPTYDSDVRRDTIVLSILKKEWFEKVKPNLMASIKSI